MDQHVGLILVILVPGLRKLFTHQSVLTAYVTRHVVIPSDGKVWLRLKWAWEGGRVGYLHSWMMTNGWLSFLRFILVHRCTGTSMLLSTMIEVTVAVKITCSHTPLL